jgi:glyoxylase-like metal-dependent hydrolase (beta-lactamase superfamily II)
MWADLGGDCPIDFGLRGGETFRLGPEWRVEIMHLPGHSLGHLGVWDPRSGVAIITDAVLETGIYDRAGNRSFRLAITTPPLISRPSGG